MEQEYPVVRAFLLACLRSHVELRTWLQSFPLAATELWVYEDAVGGVKFHEECIEGYTRVLALLEQMGAKLGLLDADWQAYQRDLKEHGMLSLEEVQQRYGLQARTPPIITREDPPEPPVQRKSTEERYSA